MFDFFADLLSWFYDLWPSYGGAIILFTLLVMVVMAPITLRQTKSMLAMTKLQPEVKRLRSKYGDDRERLNQEMMALYQANGVNPLGGCLPLLIQAPIFLVLFRVVQGLSRRVSDIGLSIGDASTRAGIEVSEFADRTFNPEFLGEGSQLRQDLEQSSEMNSLGLDLSQSPSQALGDGFVSGLPYLAMVIAVGVTSWLQQKQIQGRSNNANINPQQQAIMKVLPFMLPVFSFGFPAALVVYFLVSNIFRVFQQMFITRKFYSGQDDDEPEIVRPEPVGKTSKRQNAAEDRKPQPRAGGGTNHGSRRPVTNPPKKRKKKPSADAAPKKGSTAQRREPQARSHSKRVTPKKNDQDDGSGSRRRNRKK